MADPPDAARDEPRDLMLRARRRAESATGRAKEAREEADRARSEGKTRAADRYEREVKLHERAAALHEEAARLQARHIAETDVLKIEHAARALRHATEEPPG